MSHSSSTSRGSSRSPHSASTTPSTPISEFESTTYYALDPSLLSSICLTDLIPVVQKGCTQILVFIQHVPYVSDCQTHLQQSTTLLENIFPGIRTAGLRLIKIRQDQGFCELDIATEICLEKFISLHDGRAEQITAEGALNIFSANGLRSAYSKSLAGGALTLHCLEHPSVSFPPSPSQTPFGVPSVEDWRRLWAAWDLVTLGMIPQEMLHQKPIDLRHKCLFYIGHIPTFLDMLMAKALKEPHTEPENFILIFERGIDPHVDDPEHCHRHSEVPEKDEDWPSLGSIISFRDRVRARLVKLYDDIHNGRRALNRHLARMLAMTHEHEGWHVETLLYMLIQRAGTGTLPPAGFTIPPWEAFAEQWNSAPRPSTPTVVLGPANLILGHDDCEGDDFTPGIAELVDGHAFGWDNESPSRSVEVSQVKMEWRPITNAQFLDFYNSNEIVLPASWVESEDGIMVRTVYGPVSMAIAQHWPVLASYDTLLAYAKSKGGRLPTEPELRLFYDTYEVGHKGGANVGFRNWHPVPATTGVEAASGHGSNGGVWEWTSTLFSNHEGLYPTEHFPGYSTDFFDGKHQVVIGASYATIPRLAERRTVRNFYQHNYSYPWVGARVVYDV